MRDQPKPGGKTKPKRHCRKCGREGARSDGCGTSHEPLGKANDDDEDEADIVRQRHPPAITELVDRSSVGRGLKNIRENGIDAELADLERRPRRDDRPSPPRPPKQLDTTTVAVGARETCPHGNGSPKSCSQCVLAGVKVKTVTLVGGNVVVDGAAVESTRAHELAHNQGHKSSQKRKVA